MASKDDTSTFTVKVKNISAKTDDQEIRDFFTFCGKITSLDVTTKGDTKSATVTFEKETAAKTALLLNHTKLGDSEISVAGTASLEGAGSGPDSDAGVSGSDAANSDEVHISQEEKPRARILAEYLAHGYLVADTGLQRAISLDEKHGMWQRFLSTLQSLDQKYHATDRARTADQSYGISQRANSLLTGISSYFEKASNTPTGKRIAGFYTQGQRQVVDIHTEARRLADLKREQAGGSSYKAAGLERVFGQEKADAAPSSAAANESDQPSTAPAAVPGDGTATQIPK